MYSMAGYPPFVHQLDPRIRPLICTQAFLEGRKYNILAFTTQFCKANEHLGQVMPRLVVEFFWVNEIWRLYSLDSPMKRFLIGQVFQHFWPLEHNSWGPENSNDS